VVVVPFFIADGLHSYEDIPVLLGIDAAPAGSATERQRSGDIFRHNPHQLHGRSLYYASSIGTDPRFATLSSNRQKHLTGVLLRSR
jgi:sirohydrochlorin cobaltochelatase